MRPKKFAINALIIGPLIIHYFSTGSDVTALYNHILFGQDTDIFNGDQNGDGEVTGSDVTAVYNIILGL